MNILIILSAKLVSSDLRNRFGPIPSALIPYKGKTIFEALILETKEVFDKVILLTSENHYMFDEIIEYLDIDFQIEKVVVKKSNSLKDTIMGLNDLIFADDINISMIFGDTFISNNEMRKYIGTNSILVGDVVDSTRWTIIKNNEFFDKEVLEETGPYKAVVGYFSFSNFNKFIYELSKHDFYTAIYMYSKSFEMNYLDSTSWIDVGHEDTYVSSKKDNTRYFNSLKYNKTKGSITKSSLDNRKIIEEINWYLELPSEIKYVSPRMFSYSVEPNNAYVELEYYGYETIHEMFIYGNYTLEQWKIIFSHLGNYLNVFKNYEKSLDNEEIQSDLFKMYIVKVKHRVLELRKSSFIYEDLLTKKLVINNITYESIDTYIDRLHFLFDKLNISSISSFSLIHGDFFFANILYDKLNNIVRLIDPRGSFGDSTIYGDSRYDYSKLLHSVNGMYDLIVEDKFTLQVNKNHVNYKLHVRNNHTNAKKAYMDYLDNEQINIEQLLFIECTLFLSMVPLHKDNERRQVVMLCRGVELLDEIWRKNYDRIK